MIHACAEERSSRSAAAVKIHLVSADALTGEHVQAWSELQRADQGLHSPFFRPEFTRQVAAVRPGVEVAVLEQGEEPVGFFPFQRGRGGIGRPVGGPLSDFHGMVASPATIWNAEELVAACGLSAWRFQHVPAGLEPFRPYHYSAGPSLYMDLSRGFEAYRQQRCQAGSEQLRKAQQKLRKAAREVGPVRFEPDAADPKVLERLLAWKVDQYRRIQAVNFLAPDWTRRLLAAILAAGDIAFGGLLSALYFGDRLVAAHLGIRSYERLHAWFPAYDPEFAAYSPGLILFVQLAERAGPLGIERIDLGRAHERFKTSLASAAENLAEGSVDLRLWRRTARRGAFRLAQWIRSSRLRGPARAMVRLVPGLRQWAAFH
jgi:CelD/BcsL family acetyltransferase involved in cellulose biosynthesis